VPWGFVMGKQFTCTSLISKLKANFGHLQMRSLLFVNEVNAILAKWKLQGHRILLLFARMKAVVTTLLSKSRITLRSLSKQGSKNNKSNKVSAYKIKLT
jgi:hypothetical protein